MTPPSLNTSIESTAASVPVERPSASKEQLLELIWGAERIAAELNVTKRRAFYLLELGEIPARKVGGRWCVSRAALRRHFGVA